MKRTRLVIMIIVLVVLTGIVLCFPWWFTQKNFTILDLSQTGQIGDTIGGILSPFIAILVGYLTFEAFRMQYEANEIQKEENKSQELSIKRDRFDNRFYNMLDTLRSNSLSVSQGNYEGKEAFGALIEKLFMIFYWVKSSYLKIKQTLPPSQKTEVDALSTNAEEVLLTRMSYGLFFYGLLYNVDKDEEPLFSFLLEEIKKRINTEFGIHKYEEGYFLNHEIKRQKLPRFSLELFKGHNSQLGHYFRHLFQMVKFLALSDSSVISEDDKNEYARIIRGELSDYEQVLLFYNAVSDKGHSWNTSIGEEPDNVYSKLGLISRFRLIKNIPGNILYRGISPWSFYLEEDKWWKDNKKVFFEQRYILTAEDEY